MTEPCRTAGVFQHRRLGGNGGSTSSALTGRGERVKSAWPVTKMSSKLLGPPLPRGQACPGDVRGAGRLLAAADRDDLGVACGSRGIEELCRVGLDDTSVAGHVELVDYEPSLLAGDVGPMIPHFPVARCPTTRTQFGRGRGCGKATRPWLVAAA